MELVSFAFKRLISMIVVLFAMSILTFGIFFVIPNGNPAQRLAGRTATPEVIRNIERVYGFDQPVYVQYVRTMKQIFTGKIESYTQHVTVFSQLERGLPATLSLAVGAAVIWLLVGVLLGVVGALRAGRASDVAITTFSFAGISAPTFVVGNFLLLIFVYKTNWLPYPQYVPITQSVVGWFEHLLLPWITLSLFFIGIYAQVMRSNVLEAMTTDAVRTARAKGLSPARVMIKHVLRVSLIPIVSLWGLDFAGVVGGSTIVVEEVFNLQGIGQYTAQSVGSLDVPPVLVVTLLGAFFVILMNSIVDVLYAVLDPRIRGAGA